MLVSSGLLIVTPDDARMIELLSIPEPLYRNRIPTLSKANSANSYVVSRASVF